MRKLLTFSLKLYLIAATLIALPPRILAFETGVGSGGGGNIADIFPFMNLTLRPEPDSGDEKYARRYIENNLKKLLISEIKKLNEGEIELLTQGLSPEFEKIRDILLYHRQTFIDDIMGSQYLISDDAIFVDGREKDAMTEHHALADIIFSTSHISKYDVNNGPLVWLLMSLAFHEHVRHFNFRDEKNELAKIATRFSRKNLILNGLQPGEVRSLTLSAVAIEKIAKVIEDVKRDLSEQYKNPVATGVELLIASNGEVSAYRNKEPETPDGEATCLFSSYFTRKMGRKSVDTPLFYHNDSNYFHYQSYASWYAGHKTGAPSSVSRLLFGWASIACWEKNTYASPEGFSILENLAQKGLQWLNNPNTKIPKSAVSQDNSGFWPSFRSTFRPSSANDPIKYND